MAISSINSSMSYTSPNFKGAKMNASTMTKAASTVTKMAEEGGLKGLKAKMSAAYDKAIENVLIKPVIAPIMNSEGFGKLADKTVNIDNMAAHMSTAGSCVTTATYAYTSLKTLRKDEEQKKRAKTLALNQVMVTGLSTLGAYTINDKLGKFSKNLGYKFREANQGSEKLATRMKGFNTAKSLLIFAVMYRYVAPVLVTPLASKIGNLINGKDNKAKKVAQKPATVVPMEAVKELASAKVETK